MFIEKKYSTVSFKKNDTNYNVHEVYDRITTECPEFKIKDQVVRLEPFICSPCTLRLCVVNHRKPANDHRNPPPQRYRARYNRQ